ncbi:hypothetical protein PMIN06_006683 [Paraphaeosphaeria minitans]
MRGELGYCIAEAEGARKRFAVGPARRRALMDPSTLPHAGGTGQAAHARKDAFAVGLRFGTPANFARTPSSSPDLRIRYMHSICVWCRQRRLPSRRAGLLPWIGRDGRLYLPP